MIYEMRKFYKNPAIMILLFLALLLSIIMPLFFIHDYESYDYSTGKEEVVQGLDGVRLRKQQVEKVTGVLSTEKLNDALFLYQSLPSGDEAYIQTENEYPGLFQFLKVAYSPYAGENTFLVSSISKADDYYNRNVEKLSGKIEFYGPTYLSEEETQEAFNRASNIEKPFIYEFVDHWAIVIKSLIFVYAILALSAILIACQLFSFEKEKNMAIILKVVGRNKLMGIGYKKLSAMSCYLTLKFILCSTIVSSMVFVLLGFSGWQSQIQVMPEFFTMVYNWTFGEMFIGFMFISWMCILSIGFMGAFFNAIFQKTYTSLIVSSLIIVPPFFMQNSVFMPVYVRRFLSAQPINGINLLSYIDSLFSYKIGSFRVLNATMIVIFAGLFIGISMLLSPIFFNKRINQ
ncbi:hypothetical protein EDC19_0661 [Natranaerovirga hydrolytica]|uniref:Uncharacterized protein n=1 Tax=Natranaerovirga hydrolytica TaxID=680378 RepID=A0A4V2Q1N3_9FIRM|nr:hypothetical protein [Natranaerovirga hydrolytica]TCK98241.1 hypothetical protein EDC19_0661 [Natranaerovirga hydrolytica]